MNLPNFLSFIRIIIAFIAPFFLINGTFNESVIVGLFCTFAIITDFFDGWYARKYNKITKLGKILDPIADKALVLISFSVLAHLIDEFSFLWLIPIFFRELIVTFYRFIFLYKNTVVAAVKSGKIKTIFQMITIGVVYFYYMTKTFFIENLNAICAPSEVKIFMQGFEILMYLSLALTVYYTLKSGFLFFKNNWQIVKSFH